MPGGYIVYVFSVKGHARKRGQLQNAKLMRSVAKLMRSVAKLMRSIAKLMSPVAQKVKGVGLKNMNKGGQYCLRSV